MLNLCINFHPYLIFYFLSHQLCYECFLGREQPNFLYFKCLQLCDTDIRQDELMLLHKYLSHALLLFLEMKTWLFFIKYNLSYNIFLFYCKKNCFFFFSSYGWYIFKCLIFSSIYMMRKSKINAEKEWISFFKLQSMKMRTAFM